MSKRAFEDEAGQAAFVAQVQDLLRDGRPGEALSLAHRHMKEVARADKQLAEAALDLVPDDLDLVGWSDLRARLIDFQRRKIPITGIQIEFGTPEELGSEPDEAGELSPALETTYYSERTFPFSKFDRAAMQGVYEEDGSPWQGSFEDIDELIEVRGLEKLYGAITQRTGHQGSNTAKGDCFTIAAAICEILLHLRVRQSVEADKLPRPLAIMVGSNGGYAGIEAPVISYPGAVQLLTPQQEEEPEEDVIEEEPEPEFEPEPMPSGTSLRRRFIDPNTIILEPAPPPPWWRTLFLKPA